MSARWVTCDSCGEAVLLTEGQAFGRCANCNALVLRSGAAATWSSVEGALVFFVRLAIACAVLGVAAAVLLF